MRQDLTPKAQGIAADALIRLAADMRAGRRQSLTDHLNAMGRFSRHSWVNALLIQAQRSDASRVATARAWRAGGRDVKVGEQGLVILAAGRPHSANVNTFGHHDAHPFDETHWVARYAYDISQTEGMAIADPPRPARSAADYEERLRKLLEQRGVHEASGRTPALTEVVSDRGMTPSNAELSGDKQVSELTQVLAREWLRDQSYASGRSSDLTEAEASCVAEVVARGLDWPIPNGDATVLTLETNDTHALARSLERIHTTSSEILHVLRSPTREVREPQRRRADSEFGTTADFARLHREYGPRITDSLAGLVLDRQRAEDAVARAFAIAWEKRATFRGDSSLRTWVETIARSQVWRDRTAVQANATSIDDPEAKQLAVPDDVTAGLEKEEDLKRLGQALERLPPRNRRALIDHFVEGLGIKEIARRERVPGGTILSRIHKGKQLLREAWESEVSRARWMSLRSPSSDRPASPHPQGMNSPQPKARSAPTVER